jgi:hypothetical protein
MAFELKNIEIHEDTIFHLLLKYKINNNNSIQFVTEYINSLPLDKHGIKLLYLFNSNNEKKILNKLILNSDYIIKSDKVIPNNLIKNIMSQKNKTLNELYSEIQLKIIHKNYTYLTPSAIIKLIDQKNIDIHNEKLNNLFKKMLGIALYKKNQFDL